MCNFLFLLLFFYVLSTDILTYQIKLNRKIIWFVCLSEEQPNTNSQIKLIKIKPLLICLFYWEITKPNQTKLKQSKPKNIYFVCSSKPSIQTKPSQQIIRKQLLRIELNQKYLKSVLELRNSCTDLYLFFSLSLYRGTTNQLTDLTTTLSFIESPSRLKIFYNII